jgi:iron complex transport system substrate-binding protein
MENVVDGPRVVSLLSSATEWVYAVGAGPLLVGRSHECDVPPSVKSLPSCSEPLIDIEASSAEIDRQVKSRQRDALSIYEVNRDRLRELRPDIVLTQMQCEVCAVTASDVERALCTLTDHTVRVLSLSPNTLAEVWESGLTVGRALGCEEQAKQAVADCQTGLARLAALVETYREQHGLAPRRLLCLEWMDPPMAAGNWMPELMRSAGAEPVSGVEGEHSPWLTWDEIETADPDVIVLLPCGWGLERTRREMSCVTSRPEWGRLRAVREGRVAVADGNRYFNRPGPRLVESAEILAEIVYPEAFPEATLRGDGWDWLQ